MSSPAPNSDEVKTMLWPLSPRRAVDGDQKWWKAPIVVDSEKLGVQHLWLLLFWRLHLLFMVQLIWFSMLTFLLSACVECVPTQMIGREGSVVHESRWQEGHYISISLSGRQSQYKHGKPDVISIQPFVVSFAWIWIHISTHDLVQNKGVWHRDTGWGIGIYRCTTWL